ncbi:constitutive coactivator of peroxisome proliferator-activated receptor gamma [Megalops cyprinoides]|uniref:constitutive coactivator of peroxisome proliferator-activated receptor gamma n=1 Tax=Megalops cyprinoides TaxID=118141 RepID=UPI0018641030|nr:constitutive coactivator of peroxisome proliferator-activated receptor gamma [Megalops cyprinoides]XP_036402805.1 constitutive coactivator of peroxisome proliferator-activated receptor gamma [Megalops cyprinoides]XP_036402806.1 constitutive coactivator of peroxisome proliferator-activated receptor gamma [Megalops cyprinoides]XP_036402807.1 constitutive coactivator of peroxisome proliferator-activated receptor gamma [Megalops cyprinoides]
MGVKGLQHFVENLPGACIQVDLREMAKQHQRAHPGSVPLLVVDGMACLRSWYRCQAWVQGGQWREYLHYLEEFVAAFSQAGIRLVFFFDGVVEEGKRREWVKRRLRVNGEIARVFKHIKAQGRQPGRELFCLPSGLATFSMFALKSLGQETWNSVREADYEIASYALRHNCMGILGQDSDFLIFDTVPYLSVSKLRLDKMVTLLFSREKLCHTLNLHKSHLPLLACLLGNDVVPEHQLQRLHHDCVAEYRWKFSSAAMQSDKVFAVAEYIRSRAESAGVALSSSSDVDQALLENGVQSYLLPGQSSPWMKCELRPSDSVWEMERYSSPDILQAAKDKHVRVECFMVYNVLHDGVVECSNTLEDETDTELPPQALMYRPARERIYGILLPTQPECSGPAVREWFVYPGNLLQEPDLVLPVLLDKPEGNPNLKDLWFGSNPEVSSLRASTFFAVFGLQEFTVKLQQLDTPLMAVVCLVIYITLQDSHLSVEDVDAYLSQAVCVRSKSHTELLCLRVPRVDSRAVQLGSLFVRGLTVLIAASSACGFPFRLDDLMPWRTFDGLLFHSKYLQAHSGTPAEELLEGNASWIALFQNLKELVLEVCKKQGKTIPSAPRGGLAGKPMGGGDDPAKGRPQHFKAPEQSFPLPQHYRPQNSTPRADMQERGYRPRSRHPGRRHLRLAPRWPQYQSPQPHWHGHTDQ